MPKHTNACSSGVVDNKPGVARGTQRSTVHSAKRTGLRQPVLARTPIGCKGPSALMVANMDGHANTRTDTLGPCVVHRIPLVARYTIRSAVHRATNAGLGNAVVACAYVCYERITRNSHHANVKF